VRSRFEKGDIVIVKPEVQMPFKVPNRQGIVRFVYDHEPLACEVEFYWRGRSLGQHYLAEQERVSRQRDRPQQRSPVPIPNWA
jgi:hypothetical protein